MDMHGMHTKSPHTVQQDAESISADVAEEQAECRAEHGTDEAAV